MKALFYLKVAEPMPETELPVSLASALRVVLGMGGVLRRDHILSDWKAGTAIVDEDKVAALTDKGFLTAIWDRS